MRILRLASSDEAAGRLAPGATLHEVVAAVLRETTGEEVETTLRGAWPSATFPALLKEWLVRYEPDIVYLKVNAFWFNYLSVPLRMERTFGRFGRGISRAGTRVGEMRPVAKSRTFRHLRRYVLRVIPGATHFTTDRVIESMEDCIRVVLAHEGIGLIVAGPASRLNHELSRKAGAAHEARRQHVHQTLRKFCADVHVPYLGTDAIPTRAELAAIVGSDGLHLNETASRRIAEEEAVAFLEVWAHIHGGVAAAP